MFDRRQLLTSGAALAVSAIATAPAIASASAPVAPDDITLLREILTSLHPGLYRYNSPSGIDAGLKRLEALWSSQPSLEARYLNLSRFLATIKCGHSYANFFNQKEPVKNQLFDRNTRLPFSFRWVGDQMVVLQDQSGTSSLPRGTVIKFVNGVPAKEMLSRMLPYVRADGNNDGKRRALLSVTGADEIETFDIFHGLLYGAPESANGESKAGFHRLHMRAPATSRDVWVDLPALTLAQRQSYIKAPDYRGDMPVWDWTMREDGIALLRMAGWALYNSKWAWESWLNDRLDSLNGAKGLIVDIRENEGGLDCGDVILSRLAAKDIVRPRTERLVRYKRTPDHLNPYLDTWDDSFRDWGNEAEKVDSRFYRLKRWDDGGVLASRQPKVQVPMVVLTSAQNSSATYQFADLAKQLGLGTLIGETTGGNQRGINGGAFFFARLPESGIEFDVPLIGNFPTSNKPDAGIEPHIKVAMTARTIASGHDPQLSKAIAYLRRK